MDTAAQELGRMARGKPKKIDAAERQRRADSLTVARLRRWPHRRKAGE